VLLGYQPTCFDQALTTWCLCWLALLLQAVVATAVVATVAVAMVVAATKPLTMFQQESGVDVFAVMAAGPLHLHVHLARVLGGGCKTQCVVARIPRAFVLYSTHCGGGLYPCPSWVACAAACPGCPCMTPCAVQCRARHTTRPETWAVLIRACLATQRVCW